ncbi:MAG: ABC transporter substrate-binding protein [Chloroflexi bacterium]|nr:ABC transporter substrate-binding protein [Chloroflexota bacterium]
MWSGKHFVSWLSIVGLALTGCAPANAPPPPTVASAPAPTAAPKPASPVAAPKPTSPAATPKPAASQPRYGGTLTAWDGIEPEHLDIHQAASGGTLWPVGAIYNGLIQHSPAPPHDIVSDLAQSWETGPDGKSYLFNLRQGVKWHDGRPFTPEDVKVSLERMANPQRGTVSPRKTVYAVIDKVDALGSDKVRVSLQRPSPSLLGALAAGWSVIVPKHGIDAWGDMKTHAVGTGPFKFQAYVAGSHFIVKKNGDYFVKGQPYVDGITWYIIKDRAVQLAAFRTKRALMTGLGSRGLDPAEVEIVRKEISGAAVYEYASPMGGLTLAFNVTRPPFSDLRARQAAVLALDQGAIIDVALRGGGKRTGPVGTSGAWNIPEQELLALPGLRKPADADLAQARKLLAEAGYPNGIKTKFPFRTGSMYQDVAEVVAGQLSRIGIELTLERLEAAVYQVTQRQRNWDLMQTSYAGVLDDPDSHLSNFITDSPNNFSGFSDKLVDELFAKQSPEMDLQERKRIVNQVERRLLEQVPIFRLYQALYIFAHWPDLKGFQGVGVGPYNNVRWAHVWISQ